MTRISIPVAFAPVSSRLRAAPIAAHRPANPAPRTTMRAMSAPDLDAAPTMRQHITAPSIKINQTCDAAGLTAWRVCRCVAGRAMTADGNMGSMKSWRRTALASLIIPFALWFLPVPDAVADSDMDAKVRNLVAAHLAPAATGSAGGLAVAVYVDGHVQFFDYGNGNGQQPITPDTLFNLASLRKIF